LSGIIDDAIYYLAAPLRLFGRSRRFRLAIMAVAVMAVFFTATLWALDRFMPAGPSANQVAAKLEPLPPLPPLTRSSYVIAPVAVSLAAIQRSLEASAPRTLSGQGDNPVSGMLSKADIGMTITRGNMAVNGRAGEMTVLTQLNGTLRVTGQLAAQAGNLTGNLSGTISGLLGGGTLGNDVGKVVGGLTSRVLDQNVELRSQVTVRSRPSVTANWRLNPNLSAQIAINDSAVQVAGLKINMAGEAKPLIERAVNEQVAALEARVRNDPYLERSAREQWVKMCRSIPLGGGDTGLPQLWLEMRPVRAAAAQPQIDARNVTLVMGIQADTRITPKESKPECPFPAALELVPPMDNGKLSIGLPIDVPFTELNRLMEAQLKGKTFPETGNAPGQVTVLASNISASGERLLISLRVKARETKSWFGFGAEATVHVWGKPTLDRDNQIMRLTDITLDVRSDAAFGVLGAAARAAIPYLQKALADNAVVDLKPFAASARQSIEAAITDFQAPVDGVEVEAAVTGLRLVGIDFDSTTLRVIAEADGTARALVRKIALQ
jgi:hypothetical protein